MLRFALAALLALAGPALLIAGHAEAAPLLPQAEVAGLGRLAFIWDGDVWVKVLPDREERRLTQDGRNHTPRWAPTGEWLAFERTGEAQVRELWIVRASEEAARRVAALGPGQQADWSPPGDVLAYVTQGSLFAVRAGGSQHQELAAPGTGVQDVAWSPDGTQLAYSRAEVLSAPFHAADTARVLGDRLWWLEGEDAAVPADNALPARRGAPLDVLQCRAEGG
ncbi:MAG: PD40 domain-containing protein [Chloroflexi bacterium]|nr:PD40 domain-containing protein [Chloroflexota bacterium]